MSTAPLAQNIRDLRERELQAQVAEVARFNPTFDGDAALAEEVRKIGEASEERSRLLSEQAKEEYDNVVRANLIREKEQEREQKDAVTRYHATQQARDQKAEAEVARRFKLLTESQQGPENVWSMPPERLRYLAQTADMARQFLTPEQMAALDASVDPFLQPPDPLQQTEQPQQQAPNNKQHPETFPDGSLVQIKDNGDGTLEASLITGEVFRGDALTVTRKIGEANVHTKRWAREQRAQQTQQPVPQQQSAEQIQPTNPNSAVSFAPDGTPQVDFSKIPDVTRWQMDQLAQSLGYSDGAEMVQDQIAQRRKTQELVRRLAEREERDFILETSTSFLAAAPDFPNTDQSIAALEQIINQNRWDWTPENMQAAHALAIRQGLYQPVPVQEQNGNWEQGLRESNKRPVPPPMPSSNSADAFRQQENLYEIPLTELRKQVIRAQLGETDGRR